LSGEDHHQRRYVSLRELGLAFGLLETASDCR
jgi:hypothetical protein